MYRVDNSTAVQHSSGVPTPKAAGPNPNGYFTDGNPGLGVPATIVDDDWLNAVQEELGGFIESTGASLSKVDRTQLMTALRLMYAQHGQCKLGYVDLTHIKLTPYNGNIIRIAGVPYAIPSGGVTVTNSGLVASTVYYVYVYNNAGTLTLELSVTSHVTSTTAGNVGVEIKSGDNSRSLVGMIFTDGSGQFGYSVTFIGVVSWFNRMGVPGNSSVSAATTASPTLVELDSTKRVTFLTWASEANIIVVNGFAANNTGGDGFQANVGIDSTTVGSGSSPQGTSASGGQASSVSSTAMTTLTEGAHQATMLGAIVTGGTGTFTMGLNVVVRG